MKIIDSIEFKDLSSNFYFIERKVSLNFNMNNVLKDDQTLVRVRFEIRNHFLASNERELGFYRL